MRKSLIMMVMVLSAFSQEKVSALFSQGFGLRDKSFELNVGYRRDYLHWKYEDPSLGFLMVAVPVAVNRVAVAVGLFDERRYGPDFGGFDFDLPSEPNLAPERFVTVGDIPAIISGTISNAICRNSVYQNQWNDLRAINVGGTGRVVTCSNIFGRINGNYAYYVDGKHKPKGLYLGNRDFFDQNFSKCGLAPNSCKRIHGHSWDVSGAVGYDMCLCEGDFRLTPLLGYAYHDINLHTDHLRSENRNDSIFTDILALFDLEQALQGSLVAIDAENKYKSYWTGPYFGFESRYQFGCRTNFYLNFEYHWAIYDACARFFENAALEVDLELPVAPVPVPLSITADSFHASFFKHRAYGRGVFLNVGGDYNFCDCLWGGVRFTWVDWRTFRNGRIHSSVANDITADAELGSAVIEGILDLHDHFVQDTPLSTVRWNSYRVEATISVSF